MVGGQMADLEAESQAGAIDGEPRYESPERLVEQLEGIHRRKTGCLITCALAMGAHIAGASPQILRSLTTYGESIGLAFQITDDLLDVGGDAGTMGKGVRKDSEAGKLTYPALLGVEESRLRATRLVEMACESIRCLAERGHRLEAVARYVIQRDR